MSMRRTTSLLIPTPNALEICWAILRQPMRGLRRFISTTAAISSVVRKNSTTVRRRGPRGCTRGEGRSIPGALPLDLLGRNDASGVEAARGDSQSDRESRTPTKSVVGRDCNALAKHTEFFADALRRRE